MEDVPAPRWAPLENIWIVSTYLRLRKAGQDVRIIDRPVADAINVCCDEKAGVQDRTGRAFLVLTQGDRDPLPWADYRFIQSPEQQMDGNSKLIKHWPQPGLLGRDSNRGNRLDRVGYIGPVENLAGPFRTEAFRDQLRNLGVEFVIRDKPAHWHDFTDFDAYLAVRDWPWRLIRTKPCTKLVHAWLTGVVGLMGPEPSYQYWGRDGEDFFQVKSPDQAVAVIRHLKSDPELYAAVQKRGFIKGQDHNEHAVIQQWIEVLNGPVREAFAQWQKVGPCAWQARRIKRQWHRLMAPLDQKIFTLKSRGMRAVERKLGLGQAGR
ncbi:hypothetical protein [uncultured Desulfosarcina sp.]|uniref:hypothetical protein n=1 Tax=uncultured Desulfosarcina sp. TaxID=218289 RepID=UPI0029C63500|nr:hypothetical protein [uncultured Desulfosarcina sp.]